jgi:hypothetical protein
MYTITVHYVNKGRSGNLNMIRIRFDYKNGELAFKCSSHHTNPIPSLFRQPLLSQNNLWNLYNVEKVPVIKLDFPGPFTDIWSQCVNVKYSL